MQIEWWCLIYLICISFWISSWKVVFHEFALGKDDDKTFCFETPKLFHVCPVNEQGSNSNDHHVYNAMAQAVKREQQKEGEDGKQEEQKEGEKGDELLEGIEEGR